MTAEIGLYALILALLVAAVLACVLLIRAGRGTPSWRHALPALAFLVLVGVFFWRLHQTESGVPPNVVAMVLIDRPAPAFRLKPLYAGQLGLATADLKGRVTLVNFFASWCVPCRAEHPVLGQVSKNGITLVGIVYKDKPEAAQRLLAELGNPYARVATDADGHAGIAFGISGVPQSYLIDQNGIVRYQVPGPITEAVLKNEILPLASRLK